MKVLFPRNIPKGMFNMHITLGPLTITLVQLCILAVGAAAALGVFNAVTKSGDGNKAAGFVAAVPVVLFFIFVAFYRQSELNLIGFLVKLCQTYFFDTPKKFQTNYHRFDATAILLAKLKAQDGTKHIERKEMTISNKQFEQLEHGGLL